MANRIIIIDKSSTYTAKQKESTCYESRKRLAMIDARPVD